jgi:hypothetical protein
MNLNPQVLRTRWEQLDGRRLGGGRGGGRFGSPEWVGESGVGGVVSIGRSRGRDRRVIGGDVPGFAFLMRGTAEQQTGTYHGGVVVVVWW